MQEISNLLLLSPCKRSLCISTYIQFYSFIFTYSLLSISVYNPPLFLNVISLTDQHSRLQKSTTKFFPFPYTRPHAMWLYSSSPEVVKPTSLSFQSGISQWCFTQWERSIVIQVQPWKVCTMESVLDLGVLGTLDRQVNALNYLLETKKPCRG